MASVGEHQAAAIVDRLVPPVGRSAIAATGCGSDIVVVKNVFIHSHGLCESQQVGEGTRIWAFAHVLPKARLGRDCNICDGVFIENDVVVGDAVTIKSGVQLWDGIRLGNNVFVGPNATFTNDIFPRSKQHLENFPLTVIEDGASIGANATIMPGIRIGIGAMVGAGAVVLHDVPARGVIVGNPGRVVGYAGAAKIEAHNGETFPSDFPARLIKFDMHADNRGNLVAADATQLPFNTARFFVVDNVPAGTFRGAHAHKIDQQLLIPAAGELTVAVDDGKQAFVVTLSRPDMALYVPPRVWAMQFQHSANAVLLVLASHPYDRTDYVHDYQQLIEQSSQLK